MDAVCVSWHTALSWRTSTGHQYIHLVLLALSCHGKRSRFVRDAHPQGRVITQIYAEKSPPSRQASRLTRLAASLQQWKDSMPSDIDFDPFAPGRSVPPPHVLSLQ